jgi:serine/threonine-protein kinase RsbT
MVLNTSLVEPLLYRSEETILCLNIKKEWQIAGARQNLHQVANLHGFSAVCTAQLVTSISELGYNLLFHSRSGGQIVVDIVKEITSYGLKLTCTDSGPGIECLEKAMSDGFSTNGGLGGGLPGVRRLMDDFAIRSDNTGTHIECVKWKR